MPYTAQIASTKQKLTETKQALKDLQEKKSSVTNTEELKALNKQINATQKELGKLKSDIRFYANLNKDALRDWHEMVLGINLLDSPKARQKYRRGVGMHIARRQSAPS